MLITLDLPNEYETKINALAKQAGQSNDDFLKSLLLGYVTEKTPNAETLQAIHELESGKAHSFSSLDGMLEWINAD